MPSNKDLSYIDDTVFRPHPIPYQGSKRKLADAILGYFPGRYERFIEPFAGSAAVTIAAASSEMAQSYSLSDSCRPLTAIWREMLTSPQTLADAYEALWRKQLSNPRGFYDQVREDFNRTGRPDLFLYLLARCVKGSVRFNKEGGFNQSPDNRRLGMHPATMRRHILGCARLLGAASVECQDYAVALRNATPRDAVYLDPPWRGVSEGPHHRYSETLDFERFVAVLEKLNSQGMLYAVSFDGSCGSREYGSELPSHLELKRIPLVAGRSTQATLLGRTEMTIESLYLSPALIARGQASGRELRNQEELAFS